MKMKVYEIIGYAQDYDETDWHYAICATRALAERELELVIHEFGNREFRWVIEELNVITE